MGKECPYCGKRTAIIKNITVHGNGAKKAEEVIAQVLACGHTVGGDEYDKFVVECYAIDVKHKQEADKAVQKAQAKKAALWKSLSDTTGGIEDATE